MPQYHSEEFAATSMRGQFSLAYEATMAARFMGILINIGGTTKDPAKQQAQIAILTMASKIVQDFASQHVKAALEAKDGWQALLTEEPKDAS